MQPRRSRRTYSCGPCKRYKMKCNLALPCSSCVRTHREHQCEKSPPNPPSEAERLRSEERRSRNSRRKDKQRQNSTGQEAPKTEAQGAESNSGPVSSLTEPIPEHPGSVPGSTAGLQPWKSEPFSTPERAPDTKPPAAISIAVPGQHPVPGHFSVPAPPVHGPAPGSGAPVPGPGPPLGAHLETLAASLRHPQNLLNPLNSSNPQNFLDPSSSLPRSAVNSQSQGQTHNVAASHASGITSSAASTSSGEAFHTHIPAFNRQSSPPWLLNDWDPSPSSVPSPPSSPSNMASSISTSSSTRDPTSPFSPAGPSVAMSAALATFGCGSAFSSLPPGEPVASQMARNIHSSPTMVAYAAAGNSVKVPVAQATLERWTSSVRVLCARNSRRQSPDWLARRFSWAHSAENSGLHELVDWPSVYAMAHRMAKSDFAFGSGFSSGAESTKSGHTDASNSDSAVSGASAQTVSVSRSELQNAALAAAFLGSGSLTRGSASAFAHVDAWLALSFELAACCPNSEWQDGVFHSVHLASNKTALVATAQLDRLARETRRYFAAIAQNSAYVRYLHMLDLGAIAPEEKECFAVVAKSWAYIKIFETVASILQAETSFQYEHDSLLETIQPDRDLVEWLFNVVPERPMPECSVYDVALLASSLFFRRFEGCTSPRDIAWTYLTLYSDFGAVVLPPTAPLEQPITSTNGILQQRVPPIGVALKASFICVRWLSIIRAEPNKFVTLRFAHYVTTLMTMFNPFLDLLESGAAQASGLSLMISCSSQIITVLDMYNMLTLQALFVSVMSNFATEPTAHWGLDLRYLIGVVATSYHRTRVMIENLQPFAAYPLTAALLKVSKVLFVEAAILPDPGEVENPAKAFYKQIVSLSDPKDWEITVKSLFGMESTAENYVEQLWRFGNVARLHQDKPIHITKELVLSTDFLREFEHSCRGFAFSRQHVEEYLEL